MTARRLIAAALGLVLCAALLSACQTRLPWGGPSAESVSLMATPQLMAEADRAFQRRDYARSELYYDRLLARQDLPATARPLAARRLAVSSFEMRHYNQTRLALQTWLAADKKAQNDGQFQDLTIRTLAALDKPADLEAHRAALAARKNLPWEARRAAAQALFDVYHQNGDEAPALKALAEAYRLAPDAKARAGFEQDFQSRLPKMDDRELSRLAAAVPADGRVRFPFALVEFERARRNAKDQDRWAESWRNMRSLLSAAELENKAALAREVQDLEHKHGVPRLGVALAVPLTGRFADAGQKIARGASAAQWALANAGLDLEVKLINTEVPGWPARINALPPHFAVIGGPLRVESFKELEAAHLTDKRAFFAFLPSLGELQEGRQAWRFFPSPRDQARAAADLVVGGLNIRSVAVLSPQDKYGRMLTDLFIQEATARGARIAASETYPPDDHPEWGRSVARLLHVPFKPSPNAPAPAPNFGAVFLPDGWSQAQLLIPNFFFYDAAQLVFVGPELWSRSLDESRDLEEQYYHLTACSGAWKPENPASKDLQRILDEQGLGSADFWVALGYDFVRLTSRMGSLDSVAPPEVNAHLAQAASGMDFSLAPITWSPDGLAREDLYLFQPAKDGKILADPAVMQENIGKALARRERLAKAAAAKLQGKTLPPAKAPESEAAPSPRPAGNELDRD